MKFIYILLLVVGVAIASPVALDSTDSSNDAVAATETSSDATETTTVGETEAATEDVWADETSSKKLSDLPKEILAREKQRLEAAAEAASYLGMGMKVVLGILG